MYVYMYLFINVTFLYVIVCKHCAETSVS